MRLSSFVASTVIASAGLLSQTTANADTFFGVYAGAGTWQQEFSGDVTSGVVDVSIEDDLGLEDDNTNVFYVAVEHGVPVLPNVRAQFFDIDVAGDNVLSRNIEFNGQTFVVSDLVSTQVELSQSDAVLYYEVLDNVVSLDLGLTVSWVEGRLEVASTTDSAQADFDELVPMLYAKARVDLPFTGVWAGVEGQGIAYEGNQVNEYNAQIGWESDIGLGIEAGWRSVSIELEDFDQVANANLEVDGPYAALNYHF
ncbi:MAG: TIGR04219 family outer membrane beta-barrel protein [Pseudomonadota bacterium]